MSLENHIDFGRFVQNQKKFANNYSQFNHLEQESGSRLIERLNYMKFLEPKRVLHLGSKTSDLSSKIRKRFKDSKIYNLELTYERLSCGKESLKKKLNNNFFIQADLEKIPFQSSKFDLIISNQALHFFDLSSVITDCFRLLKDGGLFLFSSLGPDSFKELRSAWCEAQDKFSHVHRFYDMHIIGDILKKSKFLDPVMDCQWVDFKYRNIEQLFYELKGMGEQYIDIYRRKSLTGKVLWNKMLDAYPKSDDGFYPVCMEYIFGHAIKPDSNALRSSSMKDGVARIAVSNIDKII